MAYDEGLATRIRDLLPKTTEKRMFGGLAFMERGNLVVGVLGDEMIARVGPKGMAAALAEDGARAFDFTGRPMQGWVVVDQSALEDDEQLESWVRRCRSFTDTLPAK